MSKFKIGQEVTLTAAVVTTLLGGKQLQVKDGDKAVVVRAAGNPAQAVINIISGAARGRMLIVDGEVGTYYDIEAIAARIAKAAVSGSMLEETYDEEELDDIRSVIRDAIEEELGGLL